MSFEKPMDQVIRVPVDESPRGAAKYKVRLLEVDGQELWSTETAESTVQIPGAIRARIVPAKTLLCQVSAFDQAGHQIATSDTVLFRVLQKPYQP